MLTPSTIFLYYYYLHKILFEKKLKYHLKEKRIKSKREFNLEKGK